MDQISKSLQARRLGIEENIDAISKGQTLPVGTIRKRPNGNFIKTANGWKYHSKIAGGKSTEGGVDKSTKKASVKEKVKGPSRAEIAKMEGLQRSLDTMKSVSEYSEIYRNLNYKEKIKEKTKKLRELSKTNDFDMFINKDGYRSFLSPGPMRIAEDHNHEGYSFDLKKIDGEYHLQVPDEKAIKQKHQGRLGILDSAKSGKLAWWSPSGYHVGFSFRDVGNNTTVTIIGRPSNAVGSSVKLKQFTVPGTGFAAQIKAMSKYDYQETRKLLQSQNNKPVEFDR
jgi:hypothetical protein